MEIELLASTLAILAREAAPHLRDWGGTATEAALKSFAGEKAKQAAQALGWLKPKIEEKPLAEGSVKALADADLEDDEAAEAVETLRKQLVRILEEDKPWREELLGKLDGVEVRAEGKSIAVGRDVRAEQIVTAGNSPSHWL